MCAKSHHLKKDVNFKGEHVKCKCLCTGPINLTTLPVSVLSSIGAGNTTLDIHVQESIQKYQPYAR